MPLRVAAKIDREDEAYARKITPFLNEPFVDFIGEVDEPTKNELLGGARALLFPIDWPEPFGLVMIEALACGTPVIAYAGGSVEEIVEPGVTGFIVNDLGEAVRAVERVQSLDRRRCRQVFDERFSVARMARDYVAIYEGLRDESAPCRRSA
jgi:glycosyltransferase involved in cell wall biosynthesis